MRTIAIAVVLSMIAAAPILAQFEETITVSRALVDVRVTDDRGNPVTGLTADDFIVKIGDTPARVESLTYIDESLAAWSDEMAGEMAATTGDATPSAGERTEPAPQSLTKGRLFVVFVQTDFARNQSRVAGQMHFNRYAGHFIESLLPDDRVAVFSFDSHLKFRLDFTSDKESVADAIRRALLIDEPPPPPIVHNPALASRLDRDAMKRVTNSESALLLVGNALMPIDGPKNLILMGWGLGERTPTGVSMRPEWTAARHALDAARATIFAFDTTIADYHDLELGLQTAAQQTGGFYAKTHNFPELGLQRLERTLTARYELELRLPASLQPGTHDLTIRLNRRNATILAPTTVTSR